MSWMNVLEMAFKDQYVYYGQCFLKPISMHVCISGEFDKSHGRDFDKMYTLQF